MIVIRVSPYKVVRVSVPATKFATVHNIQMFWEHKELRRREVLSPFSSSNGRCLPVVEQELS